MSHVIGTSFHGVLLKMLHLPEPSDMANTIKQDDDIIVQIIPLQ